MTDVALPLASRPRRTRVRREPTARAASRAVRRSTPRTTARTWRRSGLPGPVVATAGTRPVELALSVVVVLLLAVPLVVWTQGAPAASLTIAAALVVVGHLAWARRVVVGADYVAVRSVGRYHVAHTDHVRHLELRAMHGGALCLHTDDGRSMRLRRPEVERPQVTAALRDLVDCSSSSVDPRVCAQLGVEVGEHRLLDRYVPAA